MKTWSEVAEVYRDFLEDPSWKQQALSMLSLIENLRLHPELSMVYRGTALEHHGEMDDLLLWLPQARRMVHVRSESSSDFSIFLCYEEDSTYATRQEALNVIKHHLQRSRN